MSDLRTLRKSGGRTSPTLLCARRGHSFTRGIGPGLVLCLASVKTIGCKTEPQPAPQSAIVAPTPSQKTGQVISNRFEDADVSLEAIRVRRCPPDPPFVPPLHHERLSVLVRVASKSARPVPVQALAFRIETEDEQPYAATLAGCGKPLSVASLADGQVAEGEVAFDVPESRGPLKLVYEPFLIGRPPLTVRVRIPPVEAK